MDQIEKQKNRLYWREWALITMVKFLKLYEKNNNKDLWQSAQNLGIFAYNHNEEGIDQLLSEKD